MRRTALAALALAGGLALAAGAAGTPQEAAKARTVKMKLVDFKILPAASSVTAGKVTFVVRNAGKVKHEFVVLRTKRAAAKLPTENGEASEKGAVGEIGEIAPGKTKRLTLTLRRGHYALICNLPGHYKAGQRADLRAR